MYIPEIKYKEIDNHAIQVSRVYGLKLAMRFIAMYHTYFVVYKAIVRSTVDDTYNTCLSWHAYIAMEIEKKHYIMSKHDENAKEADILLCKRH